MQTTKLRIKHINVSEIKDILQSFLKQKKYISELKAFTPDGAIMIVYDKKPESSTFITLMEAFASRWLIPNRIKIQIEISQHQEDCDISITGDVMMAEMDIVDYDPRPAGTARLNHAIGEMASLLTNQKPSP